jgi:hypothetical protein
MNYGNFEYRVVFKNSEGYYIMKLFEKDGKYYFISKEPSIPYGNLLENLKADLLSFSNALNKSALDYSEILDTKELKPTELTL